MLNWIWAQYGMTWTENLISHNATVSGELYHVASRDNYTAECQGSVGLHSGSPDLVLESFLEMTVSKKISLFVGDLNICFYLCKEHGFIEDFPSLITSYTDTDVSRLAG